MVRSTALAAAAAEVAAIAATSPAMMALDSKAAALFASLIEDGSANKRTVMKSSAQAAHLRAPSVPRVVSGCMTTWGSDAVPAIRQIMNSRLLAVILML